MLRIVIVGAAGYSGAELTGLLLGHPDVDVVGLFASARREADGGPVLFADLHPRWRGATDLPVRAFDLQAVTDLAPDAVFLATPHEASHDLAPKLLDAGITVFDLSGAFRLDAAACEHHYGFAHTHPELLDAAVYGLAELAGPGLATANLIAVPGCYPTSVILPLAPLETAGAIDVACDVVVNAVSGVSGAGRTPSAKTHFCEVSFQPYGVFTHRHTPEIARYVGRPVVFTPHLAAWDRGIVSTTHLRLAAGWTADTVRGVLSEQYEDAPFVRLLAPGQWPSVAAVQGTNFCDIGLATDDTGQRLIVVSAIDNLLKGAAGQAMQCLNIRYGLPVTAGFREVTTCLVT